MSRAGHVVAARPAPSVREAFDGPVRHVYVHVPFCRAKCDYCDFASVPVGDPAGGPAGAENDRRAGAKAARLFDEFVAGVSAEWERERAAHGVRRLSTLYLGGGTPSLLGPDRLERLLEVFRPSLTPRAEATVEANPEDVDDAFAAWAAAARGAGSAGAGRGPSGLRVSLGVQSFSPELRQALGRRAAADPAGAVVRLRHAGVGNLSIDLIHGIPGQTAALLEDDLGTVLELRPEHVSWYELTVAPGTPLARRLAVPGPLPPDGSRDPGGPPGPNDDTGAGLYRRIIRALSGAGYDWYEVSSFALPGRKARHNLAYWRARPYLGLGPGAVSTAGARRWTNAAEPASWSAALSAGASPPRRVEDLSAAQRARERLFLAARCGEPVPLEEISAGVDADAAGGLARAGLVSLHSGTIRVTRKGRHVANEVCVRLFRDTHLRG